MKAKAFCIALIVGFILSSSVSNASDLVPMEDVKMLDEQIIGTAGMDAAHWGRERREGGRRERREGWSRERRERRDRREGWSRERNHRERNHRERHH